MPSTHWLDFLLLHCVGPGRRFVWMRRSPPRICLSTRIKLEEDTVTLVILLGTDNGARARPEGEEHYDIYIPL